MSEQRVDLMELLARKRLGMPDTWGVYKWEWKGNFLLLTGAVCTERYKRGPRKGGRNWTKRDRDTDLTVTTSEAERIAFFEAWEAETGKCSTCQGTGQEWAGWSRDTGTRYAPCTRCGATGKALKPAVSAAA